MQGAIAECIDRLVGNPRHPGLNVHRVQGTRDVWEAYIDGANRITFRFGNRSYEFLNHCNHDVLRRPGG